MGRSVAAAAAAAAAVVVAVDTDNSAADLAVDAADSSGSSPDVEASPVLKNVYSRVSN